MWLSASHNHYHPCVLWCSWLPAFTEALSVGVFWTATTFSEAEANWRKGCQYSRRDWWCSLHTARFGQSKFVCNILFMFVYVCICWRTSWSPFQGFLRTKLLQRLRYILEVLQPNDVVVDFAMRIITRICRHSLQAASEASPVIKPLVTPTPPLHVCHMYSRCAVVQDCWTRYSNVI